MITVETFVDILDLGGTFVFAISGAVAAVNRRLDIFGILVMSFVTGNFGGVTRDLLIGAVPPAALTDGRYLLVSVLAGLITFFGMPASTGCAIPCFCSTRSDYHSLLSLVRKRPPRWD
jgi:uncharacterized membrane protein YeiH